MSLGQFLIIFTPHSGISGLTQLTYLAQDFLEIGKKIQQIQ